MYKLKDCKSMEQTGRMAAWDTEFETAANRMTHRMMNGITVVADFGLNHYWVSKPDGETADSGELTMTVREWHSYLRALSEVEWHHCENAEAR